MTEARIRRAPDGSVIEIRVKGHAGYAEHGEDIVCAAVSALAQTALIGLEKVARHPFESKIADGYLVCRLMPGGSPESAAMAQAILQTTVLGLQDIAKDYHQFVRVTEGG